MTLFVYSSRFPVPAEELFEFHLHSANLAAISPAFPQLRLLEFTEVSRPGDRQRIRLSFGPLRQTWTARVTHVVPPRLVEDTMEDGPFRRWRHQHRVQAEMPGTSRLTDAVSFRLLPTPAGEFCEWLLVRPVLWLMFRDRHRRTRALLAHHKD